MSSPLRNQADDVAVRRLVDAMTRCDAECDAAHRAVDATSAYLRSQWTGGASDKFDQSLVEWKAAL